MRTTDFDYKRYLASREWAVLREAVRERCEGWCERCHHAPHQDTHHLTYERIGHENDDDLAGVCRECHTFLSGKSSDDPLARAFIASEILRREKGPDFHMVVASHPREPYAPDWTHAGMFWVHCRPDIFGACPWCSLEAYAVEDVFYWARIFPMVNYQ